jgi:hypothetical protein
MFQIQSRVCFLSLLSNLTNTLQVEIDSTNAGMTMPSDHGLLCWFALSSYFQNFSKNNEWFCSDKKMEMSI